MEVSSNTPAIVTGGASGLGAATARAIAAKGGKVAIFVLFMLGDQDYQNRNRKQTDAFSFIRPTRCCYCQ